MISGDPSSILGDGKCPFLVFWGVRFLRLLYGSLFVRLAVLLLLFCVGCHQMVAAESFSPIKEALLFINGFAQTPLPKRIKCERENSIVV